MLILNYRQQLLPVSYSTLGLFNLHSRFNINTKNNTIVGLIGESGSGKTTFIDLIIGFLEPSEGKILVDNQNIFENRRIWQNNIGYIPQFIYLTDDTIKRNIASIPS